VTVQERVVFSQGGYPIGHRELDRSYWAVKLDGGHGSDVWRCELDLVDTHSPKWVTQHNPDTGFRDPIDLLSPKRTLDWSDDLCTLGDWRRIKELWLVCPMTPTSPSGNIARLPITQPGTAFQFKVGVMDTNLGTSLHRPLAQIIGRVTDEGTGACECWVYDYAASALILFADEQTGQLGPWKTNVYRMGSWRPEIVGMPSVAPIGRLSTGVLGLHFGDGVRWEEEAPG
jgi:hypothetical protein